MTCVQEQQMKQMIDERVLMTEYLLTRINSLTMMIKNLPRANVRS